MPRRLVWIALTLIGASAARSADSLTALPSWVPRDPGAGIELSPHAVALDPLGRVWILDRLRGRVALLDERGEGRSIALEWDRARAIRPAEDLAASGAFLFLLEPAGPSLSLLDLEGHYRERVDMEGELEAAGRQGFAASRILVDRSGDLWLIESRTGSLLRLDRRGRFLDAPLDLLIGAARPRRIADAALGPGDELILLDADGGRLVTLSADGIPQGESPLERPIVKPASLAVDRTGRRVVCEGSGRVRLFDRDGALLWNGQAPGPPPAGPHRTCVTAEGILILADPTARRIARWRLPDGGRRDAGP